MAESNEIQNREHDQVAGIKRVTLFPASAKKIVDTATTGITYVCIAAPGTATGTAKAWFIEKIDTTVTNVTTITHATDSYDNRASASYA